MKSILQVCKLPPSPTWTPSNRHILLADGAGSTTRPQCFHRITKRLAANVAVGLPTQEYIHQQLMCKYLQETCCYLKHLMTTPAFQQHMLNWSHWPAPGYTNRVHGLLCKTNFLATHGKKQVQKTRSVSCVSLTSALPLEYRFFCTVSYFSQAPPTLCLLQKCFVAPKFSLTKLHHWACSFPIHCCPKTAAEGTNQQCREPEKRVMYLGNIML